MSNDLAGQQHWDRRELVVRPRVPSRLNVTVADLTNLLGRHIRRGYSVLEAGCAPGKYLLWCAIEAGAKVSGVEYASQSYEAAARLFSETGVPIDLRHEDFLQTSFPSRSFDLVYSLGLIEHFTGESLEQMIRKHVELLKPGGTALIVIPNFRSWYGRLFAKIDKPGFDTHNTAIMTIDALRGLAPAALVGDIHTYRYGRLTPWILIYGKPKNPIAKLLMYGTNLIGLLQPMEIHMLCPWLVLEMKRRSET